MAQLTFKYSSSQPHQTEAIDAVVNLFKGQQFMTGTFTAQEAGVREEAGGQMRNLEFLAGYGNSVSISTLQLQENLHQVQEDNCLEPTEVLSDGYLRDFTVEMETGTGKTYVYIRTIYELNKRYGLTKFIIVVPSVAIREGVKKSFQTMKEHFDELYDRTPLDYFVYDAKDMGKIGSFATSNSIQVMIINIDAFNKGFDKDGSADEGNLFHRRSDHLMDGRSPQELVSACRPIVIIDEPQSVDNTPKAQAAIRSLNPLFVLRYSATHKQKYNMVYRLTPVDAFERKLVKSICVDSVAAEANANGAYIKLEGVKDGPFGARLTLDVRQKNGTQKRKAVNVGPHTDLYVATNENSDYNADDIRWIVDNIVTDEGEERVEFLNGKVLRVGESFGDVSAEVVKRAQIRQTIEDHLQRQFQLYDDGIKVLSLFFLDRVDRYRVYSDNGSEPGEYAKVFEREYAAVLKKRAPKNICEEAGAESDASWAACYKAKGIPLVTDPARVHEGYFAKDKKGRLKDSRGAAGTEDDRSAFELIMKKKETLISFPDGKDPDKDVAFIFSHSALKEGWDNPNVFQICTLVETKDTMTKRQKIGRGLRLAVNHNGERVMGDDVNVLTVIANESYKEFARGLQTEFEKDGLEFGILTAQSFSSIESKDANGNTSKLGYKGSKAVFDFLAQNGLVDKRGAIQPALKEAAEAGTIELPPALAELPERQRAQITAQIKDVIERKARKVRIANKKNEVAVEFNTAVSKNDSFEALFNHIRCTTRFEVDVDSDELIQQCIEEIDRNMPRVNPPRVTTERSNLSVDASGVSASESTSKQEIQIESNPKYDLPDPVAELQDVVGLTRKTLCAILGGCQRLNDFPNDPATFIALVAEKINLVKNRLLSQGVTYEVLPKSQWYEKRDFKPEGYSAYVGQNAYEMDSTKCAYNYVVYDSKTVELPFAKQLEKSESVLVYIKLPPTYTIDTPLGTYNPDWAYVEEDETGRKCLYLVLETKGGKHGNLWLSDSEEQKIECAKRHYVALRKKDLYYLQDNEYRSYAQQVIGEFDSRSNESRALAFKAKLNHWFELYPGCDDWDIDLMASSLVKAEARFAENGDLFMGSLTDAAIPDFRDKVWEALESFDYGEKQQVKDFFQFVLQKSDVFDDVVKAFASDCRPIQGGTLGSYESKVAKKRVLISYTRADNEELGSLLERVGKAAITELSGELENVELIATFDDDDLRPGVDFNEELRRLICDSDIIMPFVSWTYCMRPYCRMELQDFRKQHSPLACCPIYWNSIDSIQELSDRGDLGRSQYSTAAEIQDARAFWNGNPGAESRDSMDISGLKVIEGDSKSAGYVQDYRDLYKAGDSEREERDSLERHIVRSIKHSLKKCLTAVLEGQQEGLKRWSSEA